MKEENLWRCIIEFYIIVYSLVQKEEEKKEEKDLSWLISHTLQVICSPLSSDSIRTNLIFV